MFEYGLKMPSDAFKNRKIQKYLWLVSIILGALLLPGCSGVMPINPLPTPDAPPYIQALTVFAQGVAEDNTVNPGLAKILAEKPLELPPIQGNIRWWKDLAVNQNNPSVMAAAKKTFLAHNISITENDLSGTCAESSVAMNINYLNRIHALEPVRVEDVISMAGDKNLIYADGGLSIEGQTILAKSYGYQVYGRDAKGIGYEGYVLTFADIQKYTQLGYPVNVSLRITDKELNTNTGDAINHSLLVLKTDALFQTVTFISSSQAGLTSAENSAITTQQASFETFKKAWYIGKDDLGLGFVMYR
jgi:hypothetical protein